MSLNAFLYVGPAIVGLVFLALLFVKRLERYKTALLVLALLMFAVSAGVYLSGWAEGRPVVPEPTQVAVTDREEEPATAYPTPTEEPEAPVSPISPISPPPTVPPTPTRVALSLEGSAADTQVSGCLLFESDRDGDSQVYHLQGKVLQKLTEGPGVNVDPDWSPDGSQVVFASGREPDAGLQIYVMNANGTDQIRLGEIQPGNNSHPSWSPDGNRIVFQSDRDGNSDIYIMSADGGEVTALVDEEANDRQPSWTPQGRMVAFISDRSGEDQIYVIDADGGSLWQITDMPGAKDGVNWADTQKYVTFSGDGDLYAVDLETLQIINLVSLKDAETAMPAWSFGRNILIFSSNIEGDWNLYVLEVISPDQSVVRPLTDETGIDTSPRWFACD